MKKLFIAFMSVFLISCIGLSGMEQPASPSNTTTAPITTDILPDISPEQFGVTAGEPYIGALRNFAQALLMQHRFLKTSLRAAADTLTLNQLADKLGLNAWNRMVLLDQSPEACFESNAEPDFFKRLQEIKLALRTNQDHEFIVGAPGEIRIYAATLQGIELLLKYRSLFMQNCIIPKPGQSMQMFMEEQNSIDQKYVRDEPLINKIHQKAMHQENAEVMFLAIFLKLKLEQSKARITIFSNKKQHQVCLDDSIGSSRLVEQSYKLSPTLLNYFSLSGRLITSFQQGMMHPLAKISDMPTQLKQRTIAIYNQTQPALYEEVRKKLQELTLHMAKKDRRFLTYSKTIKGELLPMQLDSLENSESLVMEPVQSPDSAKAEVKTQKAPKVKQKISKTKKKKATKPETKSKRHKALSHKETPLDDSQDTQEQSELPAPSTLSAIADQVVAEQEVQPEVSVNACACPDQGAATSSAAAEHPEKISPVPETSTKSKCKKVKPAAACAASSSAADHGTPNLIDIPYSDGQVVHAEEGDMVEIDDPCNKMRLFLYQTDSTDITRISYKPCYRPNVSVWFKSAKTALSNQGYLEASSEKYAGTASEQNRIIRIHRFSRLVDRFIPTMGVSRSVPSRIPGHANEREIVIPGYVEFYESETKRSCLFVYIIDSANDKCFHRNIQFKDALKVFAEFYKKGFFEVNPQ